MATQTTRRCHWIPQAYLQAFASDPDARKIWRLGKSAGDPELKPISKVAVKFHLYAPKSFDGRRDDKLEKKLSSLENWLGTPVWKAFCTNYVDFGWRPLRQILALVVATTYLRNPIQFEETKTLHRYLVDQVDSGPGFPDAMKLNGIIRPLSSDGWPAYRDATENDVQKMWTEQIGTASWLAKILVEMRWAIVFSKEPVFITSDNPVMILHPSLKFRGLRDSQSFVAFPLSPTRILVMDNRHDEPNSVYCPLQCNPGCWNGLIWRNSINYMFSPRHPDIICAEIADDAEVNKSYKP